MFMRNGFITRQNGIRPAFTLVELLVTAAISLLVMGGGIVAFGQFQDNQKSLVVARNTQQLFRSAQVKARAQEKPSNSECKQLIGYRLIVGPSTASINPVCIKTDDTIKLDFSTTQTVSFESVSVSPTSGTFIFPTLSNEVKSSLSPSTLIGTTTFTFGSSPNEYKFTVSPSGVISPVVNSSGVVVD